jgi:hypothetical protein
MGVFVTAAGELGQQSIGRQNDKLFCAFALISNSSSHGLVIGDA